jgi:hypothetical protein
LHRSTSLDFCRLRYPYLQRLFQLFIGLNAFYRLLVLAVFRTKPTK